MNIDMFHTLLEKDSIFILNLRVVYFIRMADYSGTQYATLMEQISNMEDYIFRHLNWTYMGGHLDLGIYTSSNQLDNGFDRMIKDAEDGKFDLIVTKNISSFATNMLDSIYYVRRLLKSGVGVYFLDDDINTLDKNSGLRLAILEKCAQDELHILSTCVKFDHRKLCDQTKVRNQSPHIND